MSSSINNENSISKRIAKELLSMKGVSKLVDAGITESITNTVLRRNYTQGIKLSVENELITAALHIKVYYGVNIPQLSYDIQSKIKNLLEEITDYRVDAINIYVEGIDKTEE